MNLDSSLIIIASAAYVALMCGLGWATNQAWFPKGLSQHPVV